MFEEKSKSCVKSRLRWAHSSPAALRHWSLWIVWVQIRFHIWSWKVFHFITPYFCFLGNNIYGSEICQVLQRVKGTAERTAYILMDKIHPAPVKNYLLRRDAPLQIRNCLSELGVFGTYVRCVITISCRLFYFPCAVGRQGLFVLFLQSFQLLIMSELPCTQIEQHHLI